MSYTLGSVWNMPLTRLGPPGRIRPREVVHVPKYLVAASLTQAGVQGVLKEGGSSRREALKKTAESVGGTLETFYFAFGETDVYLIVDVPDDAAAAALSMSITATGAVRVKTTVLITPEEMDEVRTKTVEFRPPGA